MDVKRNGDKHGQDEPGPMFDALMYDGSSRLKHAWLMGRASFWYTASYIGNTDPEHEPVFTWWDAIKAGIDCFWDNLWRKNQ